MCPESGRNEVRRLIAGLTSVVQGLEQLRRAIADFALESA